MMTNLRLNAVLSAIDLINEQDKNQIMSNGELKPKELVYGHQMSACLDQYWPHADELLKIAVRGQHIKRWQIKRDEYEAGKVGYLKWRKELGKLHAQLTTDIMLEHGYSEEEAAQTAAIIRKEKFKTNADSQTLEDVACLVFLQHYFDDFSAKHDQEKVINIVRKTWGKMSDGAHNIALSLTLPNHLATLVKKALA